MSETEEVIFEEIAGLDGALGIITLNRPQVLNALNHAMFLALDKQLAAWETNDNIKAVVIKATEGRAFCAGGDIRSAYERGLAKDPTLPNFFGDEYRLDSRIYHYPKPYIALMDGITMGGGVGISVNGAHRVATERVVLAMPETGIGFFPDVGASYFLSRLPGKMGLYLGLTGARISAADCFALGLVNYVVSQDSFAEIITMLAKTSLQKNPEAVVTEIINHFAETVGKSELLTHQAEIDMCFAKKSVEDIVDALEHYPSAWCEQVVNVLKVKSPTSLQVTFKQLQRGAKLDFDACIGMELCLTRHFMQSHDFFEGVRAVVIDKDQSPQWQPARLEDVKEEDVEKYFSDM